MKSKTVQVKEQAKSDTEQRSLTNRLSFGLLDKPDTEATAAPAPVTAPEAPAASTDKPSWKNRFKLWPVRQAGSKNHG